MESQYGTGLGIQNRFDLLLDDDGSKDPLNTIGKISKNKKKKAKPKVGTDNVVQTKTSDMTQGNRKCKAESIKGSGNKPASELTRPAAIMPLPNAAASLAPVFTRQLTLDEYKESTAHRIIRNPPQYNLRQPGEGEDQTQWENLVVLDKKKHLGDGERVNREELEIGKRAARQKPLAIEQTFQDRIGRKHQRELTAAAIAAMEPPSHWQRPPSVDNKTEFPSLSK